MNDLQTGKSASVLIVDDSRTDLRLLTCMLEGRGYSVRPFRDGSLAIASIQVEPPDLILLDIVMPSPDGYEICTQLKGDEKTRDIPVIFLSAASETFNKVQAFSIGGNDYITKPYQLEEIIARIENQLKIFRLQKQLKEQNIRLQEEIRERELMEQKLQSSQLEIRAFFEAMSDIVLIVDISGKVIKVAPTDPERLYSPNTNILNKTIEIFFGERAEFFRDRIKYALDTQQVVSCEYSIDIGENLVWFAASLTPTTENTVAWVARDISDRFYGEEKLKESEANLAAAQKVAHIGSWEYDLSSKEITWSEESFHIFGLDPNGKEPTYADLIELIHPDDRKIFQKSVRLAIKSNQPYRLDLRILNNDGTIRNIETRGETIVNQRGKLAKLWGTILDITTRKQAEDELRLLLETTQSISQASEINNALASILHLICTTINWNFGEAWMPSEKGEVLKLSSAWYGNNASLEEFQDYSETLSLTGDGEMVGQVWLAKQPQWIEDIAKVSNKTFIRRNKAIKCGLKAAFAVPVMADGQVLVILVFLQRTCCAKNQRTLDLVSAVAAQLGSLIHRKQTEAALKISQERLQLALEGSNMGLWDWNLSTEKIYRDRAWKRMLGYEEDEIKDDLEAFDRLLHPDDMPVVKQARNAYLQGATSLYEVEFRMRSKSGKWKWILCHGKIFEWNAQGKPLRMTGTHKDIDARKLAEQALEESVEREKALSSVIQKIRETLDIETIFAATTSQLRQVIDCDRVLVYRFNSDWSGELVAESVGSEWTPLLQQFDPILNRNAIAAENCAITNLSNISNFVQDTYLQKTQGGVFNRERYYLAVEDIYKARFTNCYIEFLERFQTKAYIAVPIYCSDRLWGLLAAYQNTKSREWKEAEINIVVQIGNQLGVALQQAELLDRTKKQSEALQKAVLAADAANRAKSEFLASMSHELRTPLNAIIGFTQVMSRDNYLSSEHQKHLAIINRAGEHLLTLIDDVLEVSKIEAGRVTFNQNSFNLIQLLETLENLLKLKAASKGLQLKFDYGDDLPQFVQTDEGKLRQVLINLLGNAIKFTHQGTVTLRVKKSAEKSGEVAEEAKDNSSIADAKPQRLLFEIEDSGQGIAPEEMHLLFEAFGQTETGKKSQQGTGLGLPISQKYVQLMGGDIRVSSIPGKGSVFAFDIQINLVDRDEVQTIQPQRKVIRLAPDRSEYRILVVDDVPESRLLLNKILTSVGFTIREAVNGQEAVEICKDWQPHLILMDMRMPVMNGYFATKQIRDWEDKNSEELITDDAQSSIRKTIIFASTASAFDEQQKTFLAAGCNDIIRKPFKAENLLEKIGQHLGVKYEYEEEVGGIENKIEETLINLSRSDLLNMLSQMPPEWVAKIRDAASECSDDMVLKLLEQVPPAKAALANALANLAENFQFTQILELTQIE